MTDFRVTRKVNGLALCLCEPKRGWWLIDERGLVCRVAYVGDEVVETQRREDGEMWTSTAVWTAEAFNRRMFWRIPAPTRGDS